MRRFSFPATAGRLFLSRALPILLFLLPGCVDRNFGGLRADAGVTRTFESEKILSGYTYYYFGREGEPEAIIAVKNSYRLLSEVWTPVVFTQAELKQWLYRMDSKYAGIARLDPYGYQILDSNGAEVGMWYSPWSWTVVISHDKGRVEIYPPDEKEPWDGDDDKDNTSDN